MASVDVMQYCLPHPAGFKKTSTDFISALMDYFLPHWKIRYNVNLPLLR